MTFLFNIILGWLLNTTLECRWFWIRFQFSITVFLKLGRAKRYCVPKGNIFFRVLFSLFLSDLSLPVILASEIYLSKISSRYPLIFKCILKICLFLLYMRNFFFLLKECYWVSAYQKLQLCHFPQHRTIVNLWYQPKQVIFQIK